MRFNFDIRALKRRNLVLAIMAFVVVGWVIVYVSNRNEQFRPDEIKLDSYLSSFYPADSGITDKETVAQLYEAYQSLKYEKRERKNRGKGIDIQITFIDHTTGKAESLRVNPDGSIWEKEAQNTKQITTIRQGEAFYRLLKMQWDNLVSREMQNR